jgi:hypothetical protein
MRVGIYISCAAFLLFAGFNRGDLTTHAARDLEITEIPTVEHCAIVANPELYDGKEIRVRGIYSVCGTNDSKFFSSSCGDAHTLWVEFNPTYQSCSQPKTVKSLAEMRRKSGGRWSRPHGSVVLLEYRAAEVEFVGKFTASNPYKKSEAPNTDDLFAPSRPIREHYDFVFTVSCVERVKPLSKDAEY